MPTKKKPLPKADDLLTTGPAEQYAGVSARSLHRWAQDGRLTKYYIGGRVRWSKAEIDALVSRSVAR